MTRATIIRVDGTEEKLDRRPTLEEAQQIVGGWIELLPIRGTRITLVLNEEGRLRGLPRNDKATLVYKTWGVDAYYGDVIVLEGWRTVG